MTKWCSCLQDTLVLHLDASIPEQLKGGPDILLQFVLDAGETEKFKVSLKALHDSADLLTAIFSAELSETVL